MQPVFYQHRQVGRIDEARHGLTFAYDPSWLGSRSNFAISLSLPLQEEVFSSDAATAWFANLLPEDRLLEQLGRALGRSQADVYGLLEAIGRDTAGALSIGAPQTPSDANYRQLNANELATVIAKLPQRPMLAGEPDVTMSLAGAQSKLAVAVFDGQVFLPLHGAASTHILKPESDRLFATVENELLCMKLAAAVRLTIAPASMNVAEGRKYLMVERYDRVAKEGRDVSREHQEDFCQALGYFPTEKYQARRGPGIRQLFEFLKNRSRRAARDRLNLLDLVIFGCCIGDTDRHAKNYSLILTSGGPRLAPGYDFLSALPYDGITRNTAMKIAGKSRAEHLERRHWERFASDVGLSPAATVLRVAELGSSVADAIESLPRRLSAEYPSDLDALRLFAKSILERSRRIAANATKDATRSDD